MANTKTADVKLKGEKVGEASFIEYDSIEEAVREMGDDKCLGYINGTVKTLAVQKVRVQNTPQTTESQILAIARAVKKGTMDRNLGAERIKELASSLRA